MATHNIALHIDGRPRLILLTDPFEIRHGYSESSPRCQFSGPVIHHGTNIRVAEVLQHVRRVNFIYGTIGVLQRHSFLAVLVVDTLVSLDRF